MSVASPGRVLFANENLGGHASLHLYLREALAECAPEVHDSSEFFAMPPPRLLRRLVSAQVPGLARLDLDLQPLRYQLAQSAVLRRTLERLAGRFEVLHVYTQGIALLVPDHLAERPSVLGTDCTTAQGAYHLPYRRPTRFTAAAVRAARPFERRAYDAATLVVAQSEWAAASMRDAYGVTADRVRVIPYGITLGEVPPRLRPDGLPEVTFVGMTMDRKGGERLLRVHRERLQGRCVLNLVTRAPVRAHHGVRVHDDFRQGDPRLAQLLARTAVFAFPTEMDNSPYAVLEAMRAGCPVVTTPCGALPEMVPHGRCGIVVGHDDDALATAILGLLDDPARAEAMGAAAAEHVRDRYDARRTTGALLDVLAEARERHAA